MEIVALFVIKAVTNVAAEVVVIIDKMIVFCNLLVLDFDDVYSAKRIRLN